jgi:hypothetical protein
LVVLSISKTALSFMVFELSRISALFAETPLAQNQNKER